MLNVGDKYNKLVCDEFLGGTKNEWRCICECGKSRITTENSLIKGYAKSCGCLQRKKQYPSLIGQRFNLLLVIEKAFSKRGSQAYKCKCDCGNEVILETSDIVGSNNKSCGKCLKRPYENLTGKTFKYWTVVNRCKTKHEYGPSKWLCKCICGKEKEIWVNTLTSEQAIGHCGCIDRAKRTAEQEQRNCLRRNRKYIVERDNCSCQLCGASRQSYRLKVHHIYPFREYEELRMDSENLITLCRDCHTLVHGGRFQSVDSKYQPILQEIMNWTKTEKDYKRIEIN